MMSGKAGTLGCKTNTTGYIKGSNYKIHNVHAINTNTHKNIAYPSAYNNSQGMKV